MKPSCRPQIEENKQSRAEPSFNYYLNLRKRRMHRTRGP
jgi:hypothetical protein